MQRWLRVRANKVVLSECMSNMYRTFMRQYSIRSHIWKRHQVEIWYFLVKIISWYASLMISFFILRPSWRYCNQYHNITFCQITIPVPHSPYWMLYNSVGLLSPKWRRHMITTKYLKQMLSTIILNRWVGRICQYLQCPMKQFVTLQCN